MLIIILFLETVHIHMSIYFYILLLLFRIIFLLVNCLGFFVKRFELGMETALYTNKCIIIIIIIIIIMLKIAKHKMALRFLHDIRPIDHNQY